MENKVKVVQFGTGKMAVYTMRYVLENGWDIVGAVDINPNVIGKDISEVIGCENVGVKITSVDEADELFSEVKADVCIVTTMSLLADCRDALLLCAKHGVNAITTCEEAFYPMNSNPNLTKKIEELDTKIDEAMANQSTLPASDLKILENQIEEKLDSIYNVNDLEIIKENKKDINTYITKKAKIAGEKSPAGSYLKKLIDERSKYENELNSGAEYVTSPESGVVSYKVDGYENILTTANFNYLNKDFLKSLKLKVGQVIATSQESGKIIDNFKCYIACVLNSNESKQAKIRRRVKIKTTKWKRS